MLYKNLLWKVIAAVIENGPTEYLVFEGEKVFGATPVCICGSEARAQQIASEHNTLLQKTIELNEHFLDEVMNCPMVEAGHA